MQSANLSPAVAHDLLQLRTLMDRAKHESRSAAPLARLVAVILLDGVNERALVSAAGRLEITLKENEKFENIYSQVKEALGPKLSTPAWAEVRQLHRVRNLAQHVGVTSDRDMLPLWAAATIRFVNAVVFAAFDVDLNEVRLSNSIAHVELRDMITKAEGHLQEGRASDAFECASDALHKALNKWTRQHVPNVFYRQSGRVRSSTIEKPSLEYLDHVTEKIQEDLAVQLFASDPGDFTWMRDVRQSGFESATLEEADRAINIAFWWIVRWESLEAAGAPNRREELERASRNVRQTEQPAQVQEVVDIASLGDKIRIRLRLKNVPTETSFDTWRNLLQSLLRKQLSTWTEWPQLDNSGTLTILVSFDTDVEAMIEALELTLAQVESEYADTLAQEASRRAEFEERSAQISTYFQTSAQRLQWVEDIRLNDLQNSPQTETLYVQLAPHATSHAYKIMQIIMSGASGRVTVSNDGLVIQHDLDSVIQLLLEADEKVTHYLGQHESALQELDELMTAMQFRIERAIATRRTGP